MFNLAEILYVQTAITMIIYTEKSKFKFTVMCIERTVLYYYRSCFCVMNH